MLTLQNRRTLVATLAEIGYGIDQLDEQGEGMDNDAARDFVEAIEHLLGAMDRYVASMSDGSL